MCPTHEVIHREPIKLRAFVDQLLEEFETTARARHVALDALVFTDELKGDASLLRRLLGDLLGGALRRAPAGTNVTLVVSPRGRSTEFRVADEGAGIAVERREKAWNPSASRERGDDSGGLTFCMLVAEASGGRLTVSETDAGTVVCLSLPSQVGSAASNWAGFDSAVTGSVASAHPGLVHCESGIYARATELGVARTGRTVLVVDDEPLVRTFVLRALKGAGYDALEADCAQRAIEILKDNQESIALLLSDVAMPGGSGPELVRRARQLMPELPTLLMSATSQQALARDGVIEAGTDLLQKPFAVQDLLMKLEERLPTAGASADARVG